MTISERDRHEIHAALRRALGETEADTLMEHLPPVGWAEVATKRDLDALRGELRAKLHSALRTQLVAIVTAVGILNGVVFAALRFA